MELSIEIELDVDLIEYQPELPGFYRGAPESGEPRTPGHMTYRVYYGSVDVTDQLPSSIVETIEEQLTAKLEDQHAA